MHPATDRRRPLERCGAAGQRLPEAMPCKSSSGNRPFRPCGGSTPSDSHCPIHGFRECSSRCHDGFRERRIALGSTECLLGRPESTRPWTHGCSPQLIAQLVVPGQHFWKSYADMPRIVSGHVMRRLATRRLVGRTRLRRHALTYEESNKSLPMVGFLPLNPEPARDKA